MSLEWTQAIFEQAYSGGYDGSWFTKLRNQAGVGVFDNVAGRINGRIGNTNNDILIVGCAFGFLNVKLQALGYNSVWGVDSSPYIAAALTANRPAAFNFIPGKIEDAATQAALLSASGIRNWDYIVTEGVVESYDTSAAEWTTLLSELEDLLQGGQVQGRIAHIVYDHQPDAQHDPTLPLTWLTLQQWHDLAPSHTWISAITGTLMHNNQVL